MTREVIYIWCKDDGTKSHLTAKETEFVDTIIENETKYPDPIESVEIITITSLNIKLPTKIVS